MRSPRVRSWELDLVEGQGDAVVTELARVVIAELTCGCGCEVGMDVGERGRVSLVLEMLWTWEGGARATTHPSLFPMKQRVYSRWIDGHDNAVDAKLLAGILAVGVASSHGRDRHRRHASDGGVGSRGDGKGDFVRPEATQALDVAGVGGAALSCPAP